MTLVQFFSAYFVWHYSRGFYDLVHVWGNILVFLWHYFSFVPLLRTLFSPFKRVQEEYTEKTIEHFLESLVANTVSRFLGAFIRLFILVVGTVLLVLWVVLLFVLLLFWLCAPAALAGLLLLGVSQIV